MKYIHAAKKGHVWYAYVKTRKAIILFVVRQL